MPEHVPAAQAAEPGNAEIAARLAEAERAKAEGRFLVPTTIGAERRTNAFVRAGDVRTLANEV